MLIINLYKNFLDFGFVVVNSALLISETDRTIDEKLVPC